jgi:hypothetical protein
MKATAAGTSPVRKTQRHARSGDAPNRLWPIWKF